jgi:hypothetical protein
VGGRAGKFQMTLGLLKITIKKDGHDKEAASSVGARAVWRSGRRLPGRLSADEYTSHVPSRQQSFQLCRMDVEQVPCLFSRLAYLLPTLLRGFQNMSLTQAGRGAG